MKYKNGLGARAFTLIELLVVIAILGILATFILSAVGGAKNKARIAIASSQIKSLATALETYNADVGFYPRDPANVVAADIPHLLFAALNNKPTVLLGGGPNAPYFDVERNGIGIHTGQDFFQALDDNGVATGDGPPDGEDTFINANLLPQNANPGAGSWQDDFTYSGATIATVQTGLNGLPVYTDPWGNAYHYREWHSKAENVKEAQAVGNAAQRCNNFNTYDIWSNGPDGVNNFGHPDSDDVSNWGR